jgi:hypothetical protein
MLFLLQDALRIEVADAAALEPAGSITALISVGLPDPSPR